MYLPSEVYYQQPERVLDIDLMCPIVIKKTKTKIKAVPRGLSSYAALNELQDQKSSVTEASQIFQTTIYLVKSSLPR